MPYRDEILEMARWCNTDFPVIPEYCDSCHKRKLSLKSVTAYKPDIRYVCGDCLAIFARVDENGQIVQSGDTPLDRMIRTTALNHQEPPKLRY